MTTAHQDSPAEHDKPAHDPASAIQATATPYSWYALGILFLVYVLNFVDRQIITILAPDIKRDLGLDDADIGFLYGTAFAIFYGLFGIPIGRLVDSWHRVRLLSIGLAVWSAMTALSGLARSSAGLTAARMGVGIGEASAGPAAYSLISDMFPKQLRGTALAIYSAGLYLGAGISLMIGGYIVETWNGTYPDGGPFGLVGWQAAFMAVGLPGLLLALWVSTLREPVRGLMEGMVVPVSPAPFRGFFDELVCIIPPLTFVAAAMRGRQALLLNIVGALAIGLACYGLVRLTGATLQWLCVGIGYYSVFSWACSLRERDRPTFDLIWASPAFMLTILGHSVIIFIGYASGAFAPAYAREILGESANMAGFWIGGSGAIAGFLGVIIGGRLSDRLAQRFPSGRICVILFALVAPILPIYLAFTTEPVAGTSSDFYAFAFYHALSSLFQSAAIGAVAATALDLVLPRMRGTAAATAFIGSTLVGLALGPYVAGEISAATGSLGTGVAMTLLAAPIGIVLLAGAWYLVPAASANVADRARAAGEDI